MVLSESPPGGWRAGGPDTAMTPPFRVKSAKVGCFVLEGLNAFASALYFYYLFFFMQRQFGFGNLENLSLAAFNGLIYTGTAWLAGRFGQRYGYYRALAVGFSTLAVSLLIGSFVGTAWGQVAVLVGWTVGICFTWPNLEALASEGENAVGLQRVIGVYNLVWAGFSALSYFSGGFLLEKLGMRTLFLLPFAIHVIQLLLLAFLRTPRAAAAETGIESSSELAHVPLNPRPIARTRAFLRMAWLANPFAYVAINTVAAVVPTLAHNLGLSPALAGVFCSIWFFARLGTFLVLMLWAGWHYRFGWFLGAYLLLIVSFAAILLGGSLLVVVLAQLTFGLAVGLIYYSSLYYSMDAGDAKGEHGGVHEAAIGAGIFAGPAIGASAAYFLPAYANGSAVAVSLALCGGLAGLLALARRRRG